MKTMLCALTFFVIIFSINNFAQNNPAVNYLDATYTVTIIDSSASPYADENIPEYTVTNTTISGYFAVEINKQRVERYIKAPKARNECQPLDHCPVLKGSTRITEYAEGDFSKPSFEKKYPIKVVNLKKSYGYRYDEKGNKIFTCTYIEKSKGINEVDRFIAEIKSFVAPDGILPTLSPSYVIWLQPTGGLYKPTGNGSGYIWDDSKSRLVPTTDPFSIEISHVSDIPDHNIDDSESYVPLLIHNYKSLDDFILKPEIKNYTIYAEGQYYNFEKDSGREYFKKTKIKIELNDPYIELPPLEPEKPIELSPLPPYDPIELTPLEPINPDEFKLTPLESIKE